MFHLRRQRCQVVRKPLVPTHWCKRPRYGKLPLGTIVQCPLCGQQWFLDFVPDILGLSQIWKKYYGE